MVSTAFAFLHLRVSRQAHLLAVLPQTLQAARRVYQRVNLQENRRTTLRACQQPILRVLLPIKKTIHMMLR